MKIHVRIYILIAFLLLATAGNGNSKTLSEAMEDHLACYPLELLSIENQKPTLTRKDLCLTSIYHEMGARPLWVSEDGPTQHAQIILKYLLKTDEEGLDPADYQVEKIQRLWNDSDVATLARLDTLLTYNLVKYVHDVSYGQIKPYLADPVLFAEAGDRNFDPLRTIERILDAYDLEAYLTSLPPQHHHYQGLKKALSLYRLLAFSREWKEIPSGKTIRPGMVDARVPLIRTNLSANGWDSVSAGNPDEYDSELEENIKQFQNIHGLKVDGIIGRDTLHDLNISPAKRVDQIKINMARWRWQDHELGEKHVLVNIANYHLYGYDKGDLELSLPVIVGKFQHQTPVFSDTVKYVEFNPYWNVPPSIAINEELPKLRENPNYLVDKNMRIFSNWQEDGVELDSTAIDWNSVSRSEMARYKLRQDPGSFNALGRMKFVFPNSYSVYMHDTPSRDLFSRNKRYFSHGCIRVSTPEKLAEFVLQEKIGEEIQLDKLLDSVRRKVVRVTPPLAIHITYQTAWLDNSGKIRFNKDFYGRDKKLYNVIIAR